MDSAWKTITWNQFGAAIDALENSIKACPDDLWSDRSQKPEFWYVAYHTIFWLDYYLSESIDQFTPPSPFTLTELDPAGIVPEQPYTKQELLTYLEHGRKKGQARIESLTESKGAKRLKVGPADLSVAELLLYVMRHVQHHVGQLNLILRQQTDSAPRWTFQAKRKQG